MQTNITWREQLSAFEYKFMLDEFTSIRDKLQTQCLPILCISLMEIRTEPSKGSILSFHRQRLTWMNFILIILSFASAQLWMLVSSRITKQHFHSVIFFSTSLSFRYRNMNFMFLIIKLEQIYNLINNEVVKKIFSYISLHNSVIIT